MNEFEILALVIVIDLFLAFGVGVLTGLFLRGSR